MTDKSPKREIRRVTALVESGRPAADLLDTAATFAARLHAEVQGLLFEDPNLRRFARLDVARVVSRFAAAGPVAPGDVLAIVEQIANQARATLETVAKSLGLAWSFHVVDAEPRSDMRTALEPDDLLVVDIDGRSTPALARQAADLWSTTAGALASMLIIRGRLHASRPAVLITGPSEHAAWAQRVAAELSVNSASHIDVLLAGNPAGVPELASWVRQQARTTGRRAHVNVVADKGVDTVLRAARHAAVDLLLVPDIENLGNPQQVEALIEKAECALLLLR